MAQKEVVVVKKCGRGVRILGFLAGEEDFKLHCERMANPGRF